MMSCEELLSINANRPPADTHVAAVIKKKKKKTLQYFTGRIAEKAVYF